MKSRIPWNRVIPMGISLLLAVALIFLGIEIFQQIQKNRNLASFQTTIERVDTYLEQGAYENAGDELDSLIKRRRSNPFMAQEYFRLLKRYKTIGTYGGVWEGYRTTLNDAAEQYPGREDLSVLLVHSLMREGRWDRALEISEKIVDPKFNTLKSEMLLQIGHISEFIEYSTTLYQNLLEKNEPKLFEEVADLTGISEFYLDAALLHLQTGDYTNAQRIQRKYLSENYLLFSLFLALDTDKLQQAEGYWVEISQDKSHTDFSRLLMGDIFLRNQDYEHAKEFYRIEVLNNPGSNWINYLNLAWFEQGVSKGETLLQGLSEFPNQTDLQMAYTRYLIREHKEIEAVNFINSLGENPNINSQLLLLRLLSSNRSTAYLEGQYWRLVEKYPAEILPVKSLAYYLMSWGDWDDFHLLLNRSEPKLEDTAWIQHWRAIAYAMADNLTASNTKMAEIALVEKNVPLIYNQAVILGAQDRLGDALLLLDEASGLASDDNDILSKIYFRSAAFALADKKKDDAKEYVLSGLTLDPKNLEGLFILKSLENQ